MLFLFFFPIHAFEYIYTTISKGICDLESSYLLWGKGETKTMHSLGSQLENYVMMTYDYEPSS